MNYGLIFLVGLIAGVLNILAGAGSFITLPLLIFTGLPATVANGTNRFGILAHNFSALVHFKREGVLEFKKSLTLALPTLPGAILGAYFAVKIPEDYFKLILAGLMILAVFGILIPKSKKILSNPLHVPSGPPLPSPLPQGEREFAKPIRWFTFVLMFLMGLYGGFIQAGVGLVFMVLAYRLLQMKLKEANIHKIWIITIYTIPALAIFLWQDAVNWPAAGSLALGTSLGGYLGAKISIKGGAAYIRTAVAVALVLMAGRLIWG